MPPAARAAAEQQVRERELVRAAVEDRVVQRLLSSGVNGAEIDHWLLITDC